MSQPTKEDFQSLSRAIASLEQALRSGGVTSQGSIVTSPQKDDAAKRRAMLKKRESQAGLAMEIVGADEQEKVRATESHVILLHPIPLKMSSYIGLFTSP